MKATNSVIIIAIGLFLLYIAITDKFDCFTGAFKCMFLGDKGGAMQSKSSFSPSGGTTSGRPFGQSIFGSIGGVRTPTTF